MVDQVGLTYNFTSNYFIYNAVHAKSDLKASQHQNVPNIMIQTTEIEKLCLHFKMNFNIFSTFFILCLYRLNCVELKCWRTIVAIFLIGLVMRRVNSSITCITPSLPLACLRIPANTRAFPLSALATWHSYCVSASSHSIRNLQTDCNFNYEVGNLLMPIQLQKNLLCLFLLSYMLNSISVFSNHNTCKTFNFVY